MLVVADFGAPINSKLGFGMFYLITPQLIESRGYLPMKQIKTT